MKNSVSIITFKRVSLRVTRRKRFVHKHSHDPEECIVVHEVVIVEASEGGITFKFADNVEDIDYLENYMVITRSRVGNYISASQLVYWCGRVIVCLGG